MKQNIKNNINKYNQEKLSFKIGQKLYNKINLEYLGILEEIDNSKTKNLLVFKDGIYKEYKLEDVFHMYDTNFKDLKELDITELFYKNIHIKYNLETSIPLKANNFEELDESLLSKGVIKGFINKINSKVVIYAMFTYEGIYVGVKNTNENINEDLKTKRIIYSLFNKIKKNFDIIEDLKFLKEENEKIHEEIKKKILQSGNYLQLVTKQGTIRNIELYLNENGIVSMREKIRLSKDEYGYKYIKYNLNNIIGIK